MFHPQNCDRIVTIHSVMSLRPMYIDRPEEVESQSAEDHVTVINSACFKCNIPTDYVYFGEVRISYVPLVAGLISRYGS